MLFGMIVICLKVSQPKSTEIDMCNLVLKGGRAVDPAQGIAVICDVAFVDGIVAAVEECIDVSMA